MRTVKIPENSVILSREEYDRLNKAAKDLDFMQAEQRSNEQRASKIRAHVETIAIFETKDGLRATYKLPKNPAPLIELPCKTRPSQPKSASNGFDMVRPSFEARSYKLVGFDQAVLQFVYREI